MMPSESQRKHANTHQGPPPAPLPGFLSGFEGFPSPSEGQYFSSRLEEPKRRCQSIFPGQFPGKHTSNSLLPSGRAGSEAGT